MQDLTVRHEIAMNNSAILPIGDIFHLKNDKYRTVYAGMPSEKVYSIVQMKWELFYRGYAWNLFYPKEQNKIRIDVVDIVVDNVTPDEIILRVCQ